jgi:hypothetical protein
MIEPNEQQQSEPRGDAQRENIEGSRGSDRSSQSSDPGSERQTDQPNDRWWENPGPHGEVH